MKISTTISTYLKRGFSVERIAAILSTEGFEAADFPFHAEGFYKADVREFKEMKDIFEQYGLSFNQTHAPYKTKVSKESEIDELIDKIIECINFTHILGAKTIVIHPLHHLPYSENTEKLFEMNMQFFQKLLPVAQEMKIKMALENLWQRNESGKIVPSVCSSIKEYRRYLSFLNSENIGACIDVGHAVLCNLDPVSLINELKDKLCAIHIHENDGKNDLHYLPFTYGTVDWEAIMSSLKLIEYNGDITFESVGYLDKHEDIFLPIATGLMSGFGKELIDKFI